MYAVMPYKLLIHDIKILKNMLFEKKTNIYSKLF